MSDERWRHRVHLIPRLVRGRAGRQSAVTRATVTMPVPEAGCTLSSKDKRDSPNKPPPYVTLGRLSAALPGSFFGECVQGFRHCLQSLALDRVPA